MKTILIGVLALQGDFAKHVEMLRSIGIEAKEVRKPQELEGCQGLIIPGGESTVMLRQIDFIQMKQPLLDFAQQHPLFGTCAGLILMSKRVEGSVMEPLGLLDITVARNAFGRQIESFQASIEVELNPAHIKLVRGYFIRAPRIRDLGTEVKVLATYQREAVLIRQGHHLGASFHPEISEDPFIHRYFIEIIRQRS